MDATQAVEFAKRESRAFAQDVIQSGLLGPDVAVESLEFDLAMAQLKVLSRHGLLSEPDSEGSAARELLREVASGFDAPSVR